MKIHVSVTYEDDMKRAYLCLSVGVMACGAPSDPVGAVEAVWRANCKAVVDCVEEAPEEDWEWIQERADECAVSGEMDEGWGDLVRVAVEAGRIVYDRDLATQCLKFYRNNDCIFIWDEGVSDSCGLYLVGQMACDDSCSLNEECASGVCRGQLCDCST
jgi:hypothetical protein